MSSSPRVLIVDRSDESREVLRLLLERRGASTLEATRPDKAAEIAQQFQPNLILFDAESDDSVDGDATRLLRDTASRSDTPIVILGTRLPRPEDGQFVSKPYHYGPLIRKIDDLLSAA